MLAVTLQIVYSETLKTPIRIFFYFFKFINLSVSTMTFFSFYIIRSTLKCREFCVHSCVTWYEETLAKQALIRFSEKI